MTDMRTPLGRVRGLGSARDGTTHFWRQRVTAVANVFLITFFVILVISLQGGDYETVTAALANPLVAIVMLMVVISGVYHMKLGMQIVIEDYVTGARLRSLALIGNFFFSYAVGLACLYAVAKIGFGG